MVLVATALEVFKEIKYSVGCTTPILPLTCSPNLFADSVTDLTDFTCSFGGTEGFYFFQSLQFFYIFLLVGLIYGCL